MESSEDKQWATRYLLDPLTAPEPADETGPGTNHTATGSHPRKPVASASVSEKGHSSSKPSSAGYPTPPSSSRSERFPDFDGVHANRFSSTTNSTQIPTSTSGAPSTTTDDGTSTRGTRPRRTSSLQQRYPGDRSHRPLDIIRDDSKAANRSPHLRKKSHIGADSIDSLDDITGKAYHHEGPYDAALLARNRGSKKHAPVEALARSNAEALRATPKEKVLDSLNKHVPLDGTAVVPPGVVDRDGRYFRYEEGTDMMRDGGPEGGAYRRWPGMQYLPEDLKGKGEPSYSLEKALKSHKRNVSESTHLQRPSYEMGQMPSPGGPTSEGRRRPGMHHRSSSLSAVSGARAVSGAEKYVDWERGNTVKRSESGAGRLRKRFANIGI